MLPLFLAPSHVDSTYVFATSETSTRGKYMFSNPIWNRHTRTVMLFQANSNDPTKNQCQCKQAMIPICVGVPIKLKCKSNLQNICTDVRIQNAASIRTWKRSLA